MNTLFIYISFYFQGLCGNTGGSGSRSRLVLSCVHFEKARRRQEEKTQEERQKRSLECDGLEQGTHIMYLR